MHILLSKESIESLRKNKNLLAFSGGVDSSALFFILLSNNIDFDLAIVDYGVRKQSDKEVQYAKNLAISYSKSCYVLRLCYNKDQDLKICSNGSHILQDISQYLKLLESPNPKIQQYHLSIKPLDSNFEHYARKIRYDFFSFLIQENSYQNLVLAHHLDDKIEWFFMQFAKGAGLNSLLGFMEKDIRYTGNTSYNILRPLIRIRKHNILAYNKTHGIHYFIDSSNISPKHRRNIFRASLQELFTKEDTMGILRSFTYLHEECLRLYKAKIVCVENNLLYCKRTIRREFCDVKDENQTLKMQGVLAEEIYHIDIMAKRLGYIMSAKQKMGLESMLCFEFVNSRIAGNITSKDCMIGDRIIVGVNRDLIFVGICADYNLNNTGMSNNSKDSLKFKTCKSLQSKIAQDLEYPKFQIPKQYIEIYRRLAIPKRIRKIMYKNLLAYYISS